MYIVTKQSKETAQVIKELSDLFYKYQYFFFKNENKSFVLDDFFEIELKKSFIKSLLKYHKFSYELKNQIRSDILLQLKISQDMIKVADIMQPEFMFHLPGDISEEGSYHIDSLKKSLTIWSPIVDYHYKALSFFKFGNLLFKFLKYFNVKKIPIIFLKILDKPKKFNTYSWNGKTPHKGLINTSDISSVAVTMIVFFEKKFSTTEKKNDCYSSEYSDDRIISDYNKLIYFIKNSILPEKNFDDLLDEIFNICNKFEKIYFLIHKKILANTLSILGQRSFKIAKNKKQFLNSLIIDILAIKLQTENISSINRLDNTFILSKEQLQKLKKTF